MSPRSQSFEKWVVLGGGYAGLAFASRWAHHQKKLSSKLSRVPTLHLLSPNAHGDCTCELHRTLRTGKPEIFDIPGLLRRKSVAFKEARVFSIDPKAKRLSLRAEAREDFAYDRLIVASGASRYKSQLPGLDAILQSQNPLESRVFHVRSNQQILELRMALQRLRWISKDKASHANASKESFVVIIGGGATGVELAGEIAAFRGRNPLKRVIVVEQQYDPLKKALGSIAYKVLREQMKTLSIEYFEGAGANHIDAQHLFLENGQLIPWDLLIIAQGSSPDRGLFDAFGDVWSPGQRIRVARDFQIEDWPEHYAIGDVAEYGWGDQSLPHTAQIASQQGVYLADRLAGDLLGEEIVPSVFRWKNWGYLISLGAMHGAGRLGSYSLPVLWGPAVDVAKRGARIRFDTQVASGLRLSP